MPEHVADRATPTPAEHRRILETIRQRAERNGPYDVRCINDGGVVR